MANIILGFLCDFCADKEAGTEDNEGIIDSTACCHCWWSQFSVWSTDGVELVEFFYGFVIGICMMASEMFDRTICWIVSYNTLIDD